MKTFLLLIASTIAGMSAKAQFSQNFENTDNDLTSNCWTLTNISHTSNPADYITGTGSMTTLVLKGGFATDITSPALNVASTSFTVSFKYKINNNINNSAFRTIEIGLLDPAGVFTSLKTITLDHNSPVTVQNFSQAFTLGSTGKRKLVLKFDGTNGDGNTRLIIDDLSVSSNAMYGAGTCNSAPVAVNDVFIGIMSSPFSGNVITNDNEPNGEAMLSSIVTSSPDGTVTMQTNGNFTFVPNPGFSGSSTTLTYRLADDGFPVATSNTALVKINFVSAAALPVQLISFNAIFNNGQTDLKWTTASEINVDFFVVEKSSDGKNFNEAGLVFANGGPSEKANYSFTDNIGATQNAVTYYRLRSVDNDGKAQLSQVRIIRLSKQSETLKMVTYPNPVSNELRITVPAAWQGKAMIVEIFNLNGQQVKNVKTGNASQTETIILNDLAKGFYLVRASCGTETAGQKIVKK